MPIYISTVLSRNLPAVGVGTLGRYLGDATSLSSHAHLHTMEVIAQQQVPG